MTWSILARDPDGTLGAAIASRFFAVGALTVHGRPEAGILASQALLNPLYGARGVELLAGGATASETINTLIATDAGRSHRQLHVLPARGAPAAYTGEACVDWCGHHTGTGFSVAGNMLAGPAVVAATAAAFEAAAGRPLAERLIAAMAAGEAAGGDKRGRQSAALRLYRIEEYPVLDIRVDDHENPLFELDRLYAKSLERFQPFLACLPTRANPAGTFDRDEIEARIARFQRDRTLAS